MAWVKGCLSMTLFLSLSPGSSTAQNASEMLSAALRLKQAYVIRSYNQCIDFGKNDSQCMKELEQLHSREVEVISAFSGLINNEQTSEISEIFLSCYSSTRTYDKLIGCWEEKYEELVGGSHRADNIAAEVIQVINSNTLEKNLLQQLSCSTKPDPLFAFLALEKLGKINAFERIGYDSISCFRIDGGIHLNGIHFESICGYESDPDLHELYPQLLWRGPGTSPSQFISLGTKSSFKAVADWYILSFNGPGLLSQSVRSRHTTFGDNTEVRCSEAFR
jgi:hypothetical protein